MLKETKIFVRFIHKLNFKNIIYSKNFVKNIFIDRKRISLNRAIT